MCTELVSELKIFLSQVRKTEKSDKINICLYFYRLLIQNPSSSVDLLKFFYENSDNIESSEEKVATIEISDELYRNLHKQYAEVVDGLFEQILSKNLPEDKFYAKIWEVIDKSPSFEDEYAKAFALYYIWIDVRIPYFQLEDGLAMSNDEFRALTESLMPSIQKARFIMRTTLFKQRTSRASVLLDLLNSIPSKKEQVVLMAHILSFSTPDEICQVALRELLSKLEEDSD